MFVLLGPGNETCGEKKKPQAGSFYLLKILVVIIVVCIVLSKSNMKIILSYISHVKIRRTTTNFI